MSDPRPRIPVSSKLKPDGSLDAFTDYDPRIAAGRAAVSGAARGASSGALDPVTTELVRLRNAALQGCHH